LGLQKEAKREALNAQFGAPQFDPPNHRSTDPPIVTCSPQQQQQVVVGGCCWLLVVGSLSVASNAIGGQVQGTPVYGYFFIFCLAEVFTITIAAGGVKVFACSSI